MKNCTKLRYRFHKSAKVMTFLCTSEKIMILFQLDKGAIENIDERLKESLSIHRTTLIISKKPGNTGISRDIRTEFTTDLLLSD